MAPMVGGGETTGGLKTKPGKAVAFTAHTRVWRATWRRCHGLK